MPSRFPNLIRNPIGFYEVKEKPNTQELQEYYAEKYFQEARGSYETSYSDAELNHIRGKIRMRYEAIKSSIPDKGTILDVGCGEGFVLADFAERGWDVKGLDFSSSGIESQNPQVSGALVSGDVFASLDKEVESQNSYDVLWLQNVLEHVIDPIDLMKTMRQLVKPDGILVVTVPNDFSEIQMKALDEGKIERPFWIAPPDHLSYFSGESLAAIGEATGWSCKSVIGDFPVDWFLYNDNSNYINYPEKGKAAHNARIELENMILAKPMENVLPFYEHLAQMGMGRDLTAFFDLKK